MGPMLAALNPIQNRADSGPVMATNGMFIDLLFISFYWCV